MSTEIREKTGVIYVSSETGLDKPCGTRYNSIASDGQFVTILSLNKTTGNIFAPWGAFFIAGKGIQQKLC